MRQVVIPAAGMGTRLGKITSEMPKCMIEVNGETLISRCLRQIDTMDFDRVIIVTGHEAERLESHIHALNLITPVYFTHNKNYEITNNIVSVLNALEEFDVFDTLLIESDLIFEEELLTDFLKEPGSNILLSPYKNFMDGTVVKIKNGEILFSEVQNTESDKELLKTVNIYYFEKDFIINIFKPLLKMFVSLGLKQSYYETPLKLISELNIRALNHFITNRKWFEIDDLNDLDIASGLFSDQPLENIHSRFGGFWRFEDKKDFTYLSNPYFPNPSFINEMTENAQKLIHHYPSSQRVNAKLMSAVLNIEENLIAVGNGASELIKLFADHFPNQTIISPTFKEYENRCKEPILCTDISDISPGANECVIIVNPNNPTGELYTKDKLLRLISQNTTTTFLVDESFMDFASEPQSLLDESLLKNNPNLYILKSLGKTHGIGGLRLGALVGASIAKFNSDIPIWNINSFSEHFMQRFKKHEKHYQKSLENIKNERVNMERKLSMLLNVTIKESHGNFVYFELATQTAKDLQEFLFDNGFIIKLIEINQDVSGIRLAIRDGLDNHLLIVATERFCQR